MALPLQDLNAYTNQFIVPRKTDVVFKRSAPFTRLRQRNMVKFEGGKQIQRPLMVGKLNGGAVGRGETFNIDYVQTDTALVADLKLYWVGISLYGFDDLQNRGPMAVFSQVDSKFTNASLTIAELLAADMYQNGAGGRVRNLNGFDEWFDDGTNFATVGGITRSDLAAQGVVSGLNSYYKDLGANFTLSALQKAYTQSWFGPDQVDLIVTTQNGWDQIYNALPPMQRYADANSDLATLGFMNLRYNGAEVTVDQYLPAGYTYGFNTKYIEWYFSSNPRFQFGFTGFKEAQNSIELAGQFLVASNIICPNPRTGFKLKSTAF